MAPGINRIPVGALPDMLVFTHDGSKLLVANEDTPNAVADTPYTAPDPPGSVTIIDMETRTVAATAGFSGVPLVGEKIRLNTGMDFEPGYIAIDHSGKRAFVTLQDANAVAELDLTLNAFTQVVGLGAKDFSLARNAIDPKDNDGTVLFRQVAAKGLYMPDAIATYKWVGHDYLVMANEGDCREDNVDRAAASSFGFASPLERLRVHRERSARGWHDVHQYDALPGRLPQALSGVHQRTLNRSWCSRVPLAVLSSTRHAPGALTARRLYVRYPAVGLAATSRTTLCCSSSS